MRYVASVYVRMLLQQLLDFEALVTSSAYVLIVEVEVPDKGINFRILLQPLIRESKSTELHMLTN